MRTIAGLVCVVATLLHIGCALFGGSRPVEPINVLVDNGMVDPIVVRIAGRRIGEAEPLVRTSMRTRRVGIEGRHVTVCVRPIASGRTFCRASRLGVPFTVQEIWITVGRTGEVLASVL